MEALRPFSAQHVPVFSGSNQKLAASRADSFRFPKALKYCLVRVLPSIG
jgi:hypothetical protein